MWRNFGLRKGEGENVRRSECGSEGRSECGAVSDLGIERRLNVINVSKRG